MNQEFSAAAHAGHDLDQSVLFSPDQFLQVRVASDFHDFALIENDFGFSKRILNKFTPVLFLACGAPSPDENRGSIEDQVASQP